MTSGDYLWPAEAAQYLRSSTSTLAKLRVYGGGPDFTRIGKAIRYRRDDLDAWMTSGLVASTSETPGKGHSKKRHSPLQHHANAHGRR
jgi:excisionase family DNA binding protein